MTILFFDDIFTVTAESNLVFENSFLSVTSPMSYRDDNVWTVTLKVVRSSFSITFSKLSKFREKNFSYSKFINQNLVGKITKK